MKVNLARPSEESTESNLGVKIISYPDGQRELRLSEVIPSWAASAQVKHFEITARTQQFADLELVIMARRSIAATHPDAAVDLYIPYLPGARSDRRFAKGGVKYLAEVIAPIINRLGFRRVKVVDPHSDVAENVVDGLEKVTFQEVFTEQLAALGTEVALLSPDAGAAKKVYDVGRATGIHKVVSASKNRDPLTGRIVSVEVPASDAKEFVVCDDICDGGRTFVELAVAVREANPGAVLHLLVTHGIFSNPERTREIFTLYSSVSTTNSFRDLTEEEHTWAQDRACKLTQIQLL